MNIVQSFAEFIEPLTGTTLGTDLYLGGVPLSAPSDCWWIVSGGGTPLANNPTGEHWKRYIINIYTRNNNALVVYDQLQALEEALNGDACTQLNGYDTIDIEATTFATDQDIDSEDRTVGLLQATITTYL